MSQCINQDAVGLTVEYKRDLSIRMGTDDEHHPGTEPQTASQRGRNDAGRGKGVFPEFGAQPGHATQGRQPDAERRRYSQRNLEYMRRTFKC